MPVRKEESENEVEVGKLVDINFCICCYTCGIHFDAVTNFSICMLTDVGAAKVNKGKKSNEKKDDKSKEGEDDDSDFEKAGTRKRLAFRSKLLDAKISDSDSDIEIKRRKTG